MLHTSPYIVPFVGYTETPTQLIFKYVPICLGNVLRDKTFSSIQILVKIARDIACGMRDIHANNIIHFDLKPGNTFSQFNNDSKRFN